MILILNRTSVFVTNTERDHTFESISQKSFAEEEVIVVSFCFLAFLVMSLLLCSLTKLAELVDRKSKSRSHIKMTESIPLNIQDDV